MSLGSNERIDDYYLDCDASDNSSSYSANEDDEEEIVCDDDDGIVIETQNVRNSRSEVDVDYEVISFFGFMRRIIIERHSTWYSSFFNVAVGLG